MNDTLNQLYNRFYTPMSMAECEQEIEDCHRQLIERLEKPGRKLVLRIMDAQNLIAEERSMKLSRSTVKRALHDLEQAGYLARVSRYRPNGSGTSNLYTVK